MKINYQEIEQIPEWLLDITDGDKFLAELMLKRGINNPQQARQFLSIEEYNPTTVEQFPGMSKAVQLILESIKKDEKICVYGDYDVDGVTSTAILVSVLKKLGASVDYHIPNRFSEGYGMNEKVVKDLAHTTDLILTCDCGIKNKEEVKLARQLGMKVIVTDHHDLPEKSEFPPANVILTAKLMEESHPAYYIPGAGMAYFLASALLQKLDRQEEIPKLLDYLALAIVADVVPLRGENRYLLRKGLDHLAETKKPGLISLFSQTGIESNLLTEEDIAFRIGPVINAAGRLKNADIALELLLATNQDRAEQLALKLVQINEERKELQEKIIEEAEDLINKRSNESPIVLYQPHWHEGVIGIAAGRLTEEYQVPTLLMGLKDDEETITGSARSIPKIHINQILNKCTSLLEKHGGHAAAAGFSLNRNNVNPFRKRIIGLIEQELTGLSLENEKKIDMELDFDQIDISTYYKIRKLAPFGEGNPRPKFIASNSEIIHHRTFSEGRHLRIIAKDESTKQEAIWWWGGDKNVPQISDLIFTIDINRFQGKESVQLLLEAIIKSSPDQLKTVKENNYKNAPVVIDLRKWDQKNEDISDFTDVVYYYEGLKSIGFSPCYNRYQLQPASNLVLLSFPPSPDIMREIIFRVSPNKVILAFADRFIQDKGFVNILTGLLKHIINKKQGKVNLYQLAVLTGQLEDTVEIGFKYLSSRGLISFNRPNNNTYIIREGGTEDSGMCRVYQRRLKELLREREAFVRYLFSTEINDIKELLYANQGKRDNNE